MDDQPITSFSGPFRFLSNFHPSEVTLDGDKYLSVEHAYQAAKSLDQDHRVKLRSGCTSAVARRLGRGVEMRSDWEEVKVGAMLGLLRQKFAPGTALGQQLDATGDRELVEGNWWGDTFWGVCRGVGQNQLGKLLMQVRAEGRLL